MSVPAPGAHGGDGWKVARALGLDPRHVLDLSASLNPLAPPVAALAAVHLDSVGRYPDPAPATAALAGALGVERERLLLTNGGAEAIALVAADFGSGWADGCDFSLYRRHLSRLDPDGPRFRSDPHNPTGRLAGAGEEAAVWDEAFFPLATGWWSAHRPGVALGSLTKVFACPGLRLGYVVAAAERIERLAARQPAWAVNGLAAVVLPALLERADLAAWAAGIATLRRQLGDLLAAAGVDPQPSAANYVLCRRAAGLRRDLASQGVVVRDCASFGLPGQVRIAVPGEAGLERLATALAAVGRL